jgi:hypothetical protein
VLHGVRIYFSILVRVRVRQWYEYTVDLSGDSEGRSELKRVLTISILLTNRTNKYYLISKETVRKYNLS